MKKVAQISDHIINLIEFHLISESKRINLIKSDSQQF